MGHGTAMPGRSLEASARAWSRTCHLCDPPRVFTDPAEYQAHVAAGHLPRAGGEGRR